MKKNMLRVLCILLLCTFVSTSTISCSNNTNSDGDQSTSPTTSAGSDQSIETTIPETTDSGLDENGFLQDNLPDDLDFGGETIQFLTWSDIEHEEFNVENQTGEIVNDAIYSRNQTVENRLGVKLSFSGIPGNSSNIAPFTQHVGTAIQAGSKDFDIIAGYTLSMASVASQSYLIDLLDLPYLDFDQPWWPERLTSEATINGKLVFASGDISANMLYMMYTCFFNKELIEKYNLENPQDLVQNNQWTFDKFFQMCEGVYADLNGDQVKDENDQFGYMTSGIHNDVWFWGTGNVFIEKDANGSLILSPTYSGEKIINILAALNNEFWNTNDSIYTKTVKHQNGFAQGRLLFIADRARVALTHLGESDVQFGIAPCPKYDSAQENFITVVGNPFTFYGLPNDCRNSEMMAAVIECFASEGYRQVTPALYETTLKIKYADDPVSSEMYDIIRENISFDIGRYFSSQLLPQADFRNAIANNQNDWASVVAKRTSTIDAKLQTLMDAFK